MAFNIGEIFAVLDTHRVDYVVVGGFAVILHGYLRATADLDLVVGLSDENARRAVDAFASINLRPRLPVALEDFANAAKREEWAHDRGMLVLQLWDPANPIRSIDLFVQEPLEFSAMLGNAVEKNVEGHPVRVASIEHLVEMKRQSARPRDLEDIAKLLAIGASSRGTK